MSENYTWRYIGPVMEFDRCIERRWIAETWASTEKIAKRNFIFRYKRDHDRAHNAKIVLTGKIEKVD